MISTLRSINEIAYIISGGTPKTTVREYWDGNIPWLSVKDFNNDSKYVYSAEKSITELGLKQSAANLLQHEDIIISARGTVGLIAKISQPMAFNQSCFGIRSKGEVDQDYLYYAMKYSVASLKLLTQGSVFSTINRATFDKWKIPVPAINVQREISMILSSIDKKLAVNNQLNDYLSAICEIIVSVTNSNNTMTLADISFQVTSRVSSSEVAIERYVSTESLLPNKGGRQTASSFPGAGKVTVYQPGDTLISNIRPYFKKIWYANCEGTCSSDVIVFRANEKKLAPYLYSILRNDNFFEHVMAGAKGTKMPRGDKKQIMQYPVQSNCEERKLEFLTSLVNQIGVNTRENAKLSNLRNALLSKLITGEIDISKI